MNTLTGQQRKYLRGLAHHLDPVVHIGKQRLSENVITQINEALVAHELIKIKFVEHKEEKHDLASEIEKTTKSGLAGVIGNIAILYRPHPNPDKRKIELPKKAKTKPKKK